MPRHVAFCLILLPLVSAAQTPAVPEATLRELSKDLAQLQAAVVEAQTKLQAQQATSQFTVGGQLTNLESPTWKAMVAQSIADTVVVTVPNTKIRSGADSKAAWIADGSKGMKFPIVDRAGDWYAIGLPEPAKGFETGWVSAENVVPEKTPVSVTANVSRPVTPDTSADVILLKLTEMASSMKQKYAKNPYVTVTGFTFNAALPPSVSINFEFKK